MEVLLQHFIYCLTYFVRTLPIGVRDMAFGRDRDLYKTKLCTLYLHRGSCPRQSCSFAHGGAELRRMPGEAAYLIRVSSQTSRSSSYGHVAMDIRNSVNCFKMAEDFKYSFCIL